MTVQKTRVGHDDRASDVRVELAGGLLDANVQDALERLAATTAPSDAVFILGTADAALTNGRVLTDTATVTWDLSTPGQAKATAAPAANTFSTIAVSGQSDVVADSTSDTLTLAAGSNITITTNAGTDTVTIAAAGGSGDALTSNPLSQFASTTSAQFAGVLSDETGFSSGAKVVFSINPAIYEPAFTGNVNVNEGLAIGGIYSPSQITSDQNDYTFGTGTAPILSVYRVSTDSNGGAGRAITGIQQSGTGQTITTINVGSNPLTLVDESASSTAANRLALNGDIVLQADESVMLWYDGTTARWRPIGQAGAYATNSTSATHTAGTYEVGHATDTTIGRLSAGLASVEGRLIPAMQLFRLNADLAGSNATGAQKIFGKDATVSGSTIYAFEIEWTMQKSAGTTSHTIAFALGGTATVNNVIIQHIYTSTAIAPASTTAASIWTQTTAASSVITLAITTASTQFRARTVGTISINAAGTLIPQYALSAAPGGAYSTLAGSFIRLWPIGASGADINIGTWA